MVGELNDSDLPFYTKYGGNNSPSTQGFYQAYGVVVDTVAHHLFVADSGNSRVLVFNLDSSDHLLSQNPNNVIGQPDFNTTTRYGCSQSEMNNPVALTFDPVNLRIFCRGSRL